MSYSASNLDTTNELQCRSPHTPPPVINVKKVTTRLGFFINLPDRVLISVGSLFTLFEFSVSLSDSLFSLILFFTIKSSEIFSSDVSSSSIAVLLRHH